jgi:hypothetical protein
MASLSEILNDPNYVNANEETKAAIFTKYAPQDENYTQANAATQAAIRNRFGVEGQPGIGAQGGFDTAVYSGYQGLKGGLAGLAGRLGIMDVEKAKQIQEEAEEKGKKAFKPTEGGWTTDFTGKFAETLGQSVPYMLAPIAAAGVATVAGAPGAVATGVSGLASAIQFAASNLQRQQERGIELEDTNLTGAIATAIPQAALETLSFRMIPGVQRLFGKAGKEVTEAQAAEIAKQGIVRSTAAYGAQGARTGGIEGMTEVGQQFLERLQAGLTLGDQDAINEFVESFIGGGILGGTISIPGTAMRRDQARQMAAQAPKAPETPAEEQETTETAPPAAPTGTPPVALPEGVPSDVALDQAAMEEEFQRSQGQLPIKPAQATPAQVAQVAPPELELPLGAAPESAEQRTLPPVAQPAQPKIVQPELVEQPIAEPVSAQPAQPAQIEQPEIVQPVDPNAEARLAVEPVEPVAPSEPPPVAQKKVTKAVAPKAGEKILSAHEFIASLGGLDKKEAAEIDKDAAKSNVRIGNKWLYASKGGLSAGQAAEKLAEAGYIQVEDNNEVYRVINDSLVDPVYSINDADTIAERKFAEQAAEEADRFAKKEAEAGAEAQEISAETRAEQGELQTEESLRQYMLDSGYTEQDLNVVGFTKASPELKAEVVELEQQMKALGIDPSEIIANISFESKTDLEYYSRAKSELAKAIAQAAKQGGRGDVSQVNVPPPPAELTSPSEEELKAKQEAADKAAADKARADREADAKAKADAERKEIAARSEKAAGEFELGKTAEEDLSGQKDLLATDKKELPELDITGQKTPKGRNPYVVAAGRLFQQGKMSREDFNAYADKYTPIAEVSMDVLEPPTPLQKIVDFFHDPVDAARVEKSIPNGTKVGLRMDVPALNAGLPVVSIHTGKANDDPKTGLPYKTAGKVIKYASTGHIKNVTFAPRSQEKSLNMGINPVKEPLQTAEGEWVNTSPEETLKKVKELSKDSAWTQVGFDPSRRGYFYDRSSGEPVSSASELYQIGRFLLAKEVKYVSKDEFLYSRTADQAADTGLTDAENIARVEKVAADATSKWQNKPNIIVINNIQSPEVPQEVRDFVAERSDGTDTIDEGFFYKGNVYLIAPQLATDADITRVVYHEGLGHFGLRGVFGKSLTPILDQLTVVRPDLIKERADAYGLNLEKPAERRLAAEEALAKLAQTNPKLGFVKRSVAAIRTWLRDNVPGFKNLKMTDDQIIRDYIIPARDFVERGKVRSDQAELDEIRFSKKPSQPNLPGIAGKPKNQTQIPVANPKANWVDPEITWKDTFIRKVADRQNDLKTVQKAITEQVGNLRSNVNAYQIQDLAHGRIQTQTADFLDFEFVPILKEMQEKGITDPELTKYLLARHAEEANKLIAERNKNDPMMQDGGSGMDTDVAKKYLASLNPVKKKALESVAKKVDNILALTREMLEANGIISKEEREGWESMFQHYVPLQREQSDYALPTNSYKSVGKFSKSRTGSIGKSVIDILANVGINREVAIVRIEKERVKRAVYGLAVTNPNPEIWKAVSPDAIKNKTVLAQELREMGISAADVANILSEPTTRYFNKETGQVESRVDQMKRYADFVLPVKINGKDRFIFFNPKNPRAMAMVTALKDMDVKALEGAVASVANVTRFFAAVNTQYNLVFGLFNFARDLQGAMFNLTTTEIADKKADVAKGAMKALPEIYQALRERNAGETPSSTADGSWYDFISNGGKVGYRDQFAKVQESATLVEREFAKLDRGAAKRRAYALLNWVSNVNDVLENAVRLSSYRVALDKFKSEAKGKISDAELSAMKANAAEIAKNITVNFNTKGNATGMVGALYAFTNASIRGTARLIETVDPRTSRGRKIMGALVTLGAVQAVALAMAGFGDDEPSEFVKQKSLVIPLNLLGIEGKKYFLIPMPYGLNVFPNLGRLMVDGSMNIAKGRGVKDQVANAIGMIFTAFNPIGGGAGMLPYAPTILDPVAAIIQNRDSFDRPIYREDRSTKPTPGYLRSRDPSSFANWFAELINTMTGGTAYTKGLISPTADHINYLAEQVGGGVYREGSRAVKYVADKVTGNETPDYRVPLVGKLVGDLDSPAAISQKFYKNVIRMSEHEEEIKGRISSRQSTSQYMKDNPEASLWRRANSLENELSKINRRRRELIAQDAPKEQIKRVEDQRTRMMRQFNDAVKQREAK